MEWSGVLCKLCLCVPTCRFEHVLDLCPPERQPRPPGGWVRVRSGERCLVFRWRNPLVSLPPKTNAKDVMHVACILMQRQRLTTRDALTALNSLPPSWLPSWPPCRISTAAPQAGNSPSMSRRTALHTPSQSPTTFTTHTSSRYCIIIVSADASDHKQLLIVLLAQRSEDPCLAKAWRLGQIAFSSSSDGVTALCWNKAA